MWLSPSGQEMSEGEWNADHVKCLGVRLSGDAIGEIDGSGSSLAGETLLYLMNASGAAVPFMLSSFARRPHWETVLDTFDARRVGEIHRGGAQYMLAPHSLVVFRLNGEADSPS
jgi:glycogen operon protein